MLNALTWQHQVLVAETIISAAIGTFMLIRGGIKPSFDRSLFFLVWNVALFWLLFSGAQHFAWQYLVIAGWYTIDTMAVVRSLAKPRVYKDVEKPGGLLIFATLIVVTILALLFTGA